MSSRRSSAFSQFDAALAAAVIVVLLAVAGPTGAAESLPAPAYATNAPTEANPPTSPAMPACSWPCEDQPDRHDDAYVFAATRSLRESGIQPAIAVALAPATLLVDAVFLPFALALDHFAN